MNEILEKTIKQVNKEKQSFLNEFMETVKDIKSKYVVCAFKSVFQGASVFTKGIGCPVESEKCVQYYSELLIKEGWNDLHIYNLIISEGGEIEYVRTNIFSNRDCLS